MQRLNPWYEYLLLRLFKCGDYGYTRYTLHEDILSLDVLTLKRFLIKRFKVISGKKKFWYKISKIGIKHVKRMNRFDISTECNVIRNPAMDELSELGIDVGLNGF